MQIVQTDYKYTLPSFAYIFVRAIQSITEIIIFKMRQNGRQEY